MPNNNRSTTLDEKYLEAIRPGKRETRVRLYREYYDGSHATQLTRRQRAYLELKPGEDFRANYCAAVVDVLSERLEITGLKAPGQAETFWDWWKDNRMDNQQGVVHLAAARDGDAYLMVGWDNEKKQPTFTFEAAYNGVSGVKCIYSKNKRSTILYAFKVWADDGGHARLNVYFPDHIEKWYKPGAPSEAEDAVGAADWQPYITQASSERDPDAPSWPDYWTTTGAADGEPIGIPIVHFHNKNQGYDYGISELRDIVPLQNALNKAIIDLVAAADTTAFRIFWMLGDDPVKLDVQPGSWIYSLEHPDDVNVGYWPGEDLTKLIDYVTEFALQIARVSRTPVSYFQLSKQRPAEGTLKQEESGLLARARNRQVGYGDSWEDVFALARRLWNVYHSETDEGTSVMSEDVSIEAVWTSAEVRDEPAKMQELRTKRETLLIPLEVLWAEAGYTPQKIQEMIRMPEVQARLAQMTAATQLARGLESEEYGDSRRTGAVDSDDERMPDSPEPD